jgi:predicted nucleic acid-binding protein
VTVIVVDASVVIKWLLPESPEESDIPHALALFSQIMEGHVSLLQPPHWLAEVGAVLARLDPDNAQEHIQDLMAMEIPVEAGLSVYSRSIELACDLSHHLFDTLYHAVALEIPNVRLVTADIHYFNKATERGSICLLSDM